MKQEQPYYKCKCGSTSFRANIDQTVDVSFDKDGRLDNGFDFADPELDPASVHCAECGENEATFIKIKQK